MKRRILTAGLAVASLAACSAPLPTESGARGMPHANAAPGAEALPPTVGEPYTGTGERGYFGSGARQTSGEESGGGFFGSGSRGGTFGTGHDETRAGGYFGTGHDQAVPGGMFGSGHDETRGGGFFGSGHDEASRGGGLFGSGS